MRIFLTIAAIMSLVLVSFAGAVFEDSATATVTVNTFISITIGTCTGGLVFGAGEDPGAVDVAIACQDVSTAAATVTNDAISNVNVDVQVKGSDFSGGPIAVSNVEYDEANDQASKTTLTTTYVTTTAGVTPSSTASVWYWLDIPGNTAAGTHTSTFSFQAIE